MNFGDALPAGSTALRLAKSSEAAASPPTQAFYLRKDKNETDISLGWLEYFASLDESQRVQECLRHMTRNFLPKNSHRVLTLNVDAARELLSAIPGLEDVVFLYTPVHESAQGSENPCHASIDGMARLSEPLYQLAAQQVAIAVTDIQKWADVKPA